MYGCRVNAPATQHRSPPTCEIGDAADGLSVELLPPSPAGTAPPTPAVSMLFQPETAPHRPLAPSASWNEPALEQRSDRTWRGTRCRETKHHLAWTVQSKDVSSGWLVVFWPRPESRRLSVLVDQSESLIVPVDEQRHVSLFVPFAAPPQAHHTNCANGATATDGRVEGGPCGIDMRRCMISKL